MNLSSFSANDFEPVNWINESFRTNADKERFASESVVKLQSFIQEINKSLEDSSRKIIVGLGRVKDELCTLNEHALTLKGDLDQVQSELSKIQVENDSPTMSKLLQINELRGRMQQTSTSLKEADNWIRSSREMENLIQSSDLDVIASKLICMEKSLQILNNVPDYADRVRRLNEFKAIFHQTVSPKLSSLFASSYGGTVASNKQQQTELEHYVQVFRDLNKLDSLREIHKESVCHRLCLEWQKVKSLSLNDTVIDWMSSYFDQLQLGLDGQSSVVRLFASDETECADLLIALYIDLFNKINDDLTNGLGDVLAERESNFGDLVNSLLQAKRLFEALSKRMYDALVRANPKLPQDGGRPAGGQARQLFLLINTPYRLALRRYFAIEREMLQRSFAEAQSSQPTDSRAWNVLVLCEKRCYQITNSVYLPKYIAIIELNFAHSLDHFQSLLGQLQRTNGTWTRTPDWALFQNALEHLQSIGDFMVQFDCFRQQIFNSWLDLRNKMASYESIAQHYSQLYLNLDDQQTLGQFRVDHCGQLFSGCFQRLQALCNEMLNQVLSIPVGFVAGHLAQIELAFKGQPHGDAAGLCEQNEEVFKLSLTPNEYITQIGQYLLTIPQHIEHYQESLPLKCVFRHFDRAAYLGAAAAAAASDAAGDRSADDVAEFFLNVLIEKIVQLFIAKIQSLRLTNRREQLHLIADIDYFNEVVDDLGLSPNRNLTDLVSSLKGA